MIDGAVLITVVILYEWIGAQSLETAVLSSVLNQLFWVPYVVYAHGRYGQTLGKYARGIRVVRTDGSPLGWPRAWARSAVDIAFGVVILVGAILGASTMSSEEYSALQGWSARSTYRHAHEPAWVDVVTWASFGWVAVESIVMLCNPRRRAVHDYIAGSVVIAEPKPEA